MGIQSFGEMTLDQRTEDLQEHLLHPYANVL
jgi:hypothetical protein